MNEPQSLPVGVPPLSHAPPRPTLAVRELSRLIADIRRARAQFEPTEQEQLAVDIEMVVGVDPRD